LQVDALAGSTFVSVTEINNDGWVSKLRLRVDELVAYFAEPNPSSSGKTRNTVGCFRDLVNFLRQNKFPSHKQHGDHSWTDMPHTPAISPRPEMAFFLIDMLQLKVICWQNRCLILDNEPAGLNNFNDVGKKNGQSTDALLVQVFIRNLSNCLQSCERRLKGCVFDNSWHRDVISECSCYNVPLHHYNGKETVPFEMLVLDNALYAVIGKFNRHLNMIKPIYKVLHEETVKRPSDKILRRILAFKKSLIAFDTNLSLIQSSIISFLENDLDMSNLYLSEKRCESEHEEVELLLEGYRCDLEEIQLVVTTMLAQIDETKEYINTQLTEARNRIIRLSLNIELCMLGLTFGACFGSVFGMNLTSGLEDDPNAFITTVVTIVFSSALIISVLVWRCISIMNLSHEPNHPILKNFFKYVDLIESFKVGKDKSKMTKDIFGEHLMRVINKDVSPEDVDLIYLILDDQATSMAKNDIQNVMMRYSSNSDLKK